MDAHRVPASGQAQYPTSCRCTNWQERRHVPSLERWPFIANSTRGSAFVESISQPLSRLVPWIARTPHLRASTFALRASVDKPRYGGQAEFPTSQTPDLPSSRPPVLPRLRTVIGCAVLAFARAAGWLGAAVTSTNGGINGSRAVWFSGHTPCETDRSCSPSIRRRPCSC
jgi:hypothetical protein